MTTENDEPRDEGEAGTAPLPFKYRYKYLHKYGDESPRGERDDDRKDGKPGDEGEAEGKDEDKKDGDSDDTDAKDKDKDGKEKEKDDGDKAEPKKSKTPRPIVVDRYEFKTDEVGYLDRRRTHLYVFEIGTKKMTQVTSGDFDDEAPAWSPDGKWLAFSSKRTMPDPDRNYDRNIFVVAADNTDKGAHPTQVTTNPGSDASPTWSPDGNWIAYVTQLDPKLLEYSTKHLAVSPAAGGEAKILTKAFDRMSSDPRFSPDGKSVYFIADDEGTQNLCQVPVGGGEVTRPIGGRLMLYSYTVAKNGAHNNRRPISSNTIPSST